MESHELEFLKKKVKQMELDIIDLKQENIRLKFDSKSRIKFEDLLEDSEIDKFTAPPKDGDYDAHTLSAMKAVYNRMK